MPDAMPMLMGSQWGWNPEEAVWGWPAGGKEPGTKEHSMAGTLGGNPTGKALGRDYDEIRRPQQYGSEYDDHGC